MEIANDLPNKPGYLKSDDRVLLTSYEADRIVESLQKYSIDEVGTSTWLKQHQNLEKLNLQAHYNTLANTEEFVMAAIISHDKMLVLLHELLVVEIWQEKILPMIFENICLQSSTITLSLILYQETTLVNLFEVILFHREALESLGSDGLLELADYCCRKMVYMNTQAVDDGAYREKTAEELLNTKPEDEVKEKSSIAQFSVGLCALTILRYMTDYISELPLALMCRLLDTNDVIMALVPLVEKPPWERLRKKGDKYIMEKYVEGKWVEIPPQNKLKLMKPDAQVWLTLHNLLVDSQCCVKYQYTDFRRGQVLKLKKYLNDILVNQIPVLRDLQWALEELSLMVPPPSVADKSRLILEQVPDIRQSILKRRDWKVVASKQLQTVFTVSKETMAANRERAEEMMRIFEFGEMMEAPTCGACGRSAVQRCSRCKSEWYCNRDCQVSVWTKHKKVCDILSEALPQDD